MKTSLVIVAGLVLILVGCSKTASPRAAANADMYTNSYDSELDMQIGIAVHAYNLGRRRDPRQRSRGTGRRDYLPAKGRGYAHADHL